MTKKLLVALAAAAAAVTAAGCSSGGNGAPSAAEQAQRASNNLQRQIYQSRHNVEFRNYNLRQRIADDPSTIMWCTFFPPQNGQDPITVPIAGKLTSSNKRPYDANRYNYSDNNQVGVAGERPGPDHMFGSSSEYRYGFDPTLAIYYDFTDLPSFCTNEPLVWQKNQTRIVIETAPSLASIDRAAQQAIRKGDAKKALALLKKAESK